MGLASVCAESSRDGTDLIELLVHATRPWGAGRAGAAYLWCARGPPYSCPCLEIVVVAAKFVLVHRMAFEICVR